MAGFSKKFEDSVNWKLDRNNQSRVIDDKKHIRVSTALNTKNDTLIATCRDNVTTMYDSFLNGKAIAGDDSPCLGYRPSKTEGYTWFSWKQVVSRATNFGSGLLKDCDCKPGQEQFIGVYSGNNVEWVLAEKAAICYNMILVPLYNTLGDQAMRFVTKQCDLSVIIVDNGKALAEYKKEVLEHSEGASIKHVIMIKKSDDDDELVASCKKNHNVQVHSFKSIEDSGAESPVDHVKPSPEDIVVINYTSGTTGDPKGVMLTHANFIADLCALAVVCRETLGGDGFSKDEVWLSYLPLPHVFERIAQAMVQDAGGRIGMFQGDITLLASDLGELKPTLFGGVPRVWGKFNDKIFAAASASWLKSKLLNMAINSKMPGVEKGICSNTTLWDKIVLKNAQALLGGRVRMAFSGGAPITLKVMNTMRAIFGIPVLEGYGQTECVGAATVTMSRFGKEGTAPLVCNEIRLDDVPEMNYFAKDNKGEVCVRGPNVMKGYFKNEAKTAETIDEDGWLHTGDIGKWLDTGALKIFDRKKNIFKLSQGEYIAPEKIENVLARAVPIQQVFVQGYSDKSVLVGIAVPDPETWSAWSSSKGFSGEMKDMVKEDKVKKAVLADLNALGKANKLKSFELPKALYLDADPFSVEKDLLTPTLKTKRPKLQAYYQTQIDDMYKNFD